MDVALAAFPALAEDELLPLFSQISDLRKGRRRKAQGGIRNLFVFFRLPPSAFRPMNDRPYRHLHDLWAGTTTMHLFPLPVLAVLRLDDRLVEEIGQVIDVNIGPKNHVAAA